MKTPSHKSFIEKGTITSEGTTIIIALDDKIVVTRLIFSNQTGVPYTLELLKYTDSGLESIYRYELEPGYIFKDITHHRLNTGNRLIAKSDKADTTFIVEGKYISL